MNLLTAQDFAAAHQITDRMARKAFANGRYKGETLPLVEQFDQRGGAGGKHLALAIDAASPKLRLMLRLPETPVHPPLKPRLKVRPDDWHIGVMSDKLRTIEPILCHPKGSSERARAFEEVAGLQHRFGDGWSRFAVNSLRDWVRDMEIRGTSALVRLHRRDKGKARVR